jgi:hypothetical protein
VYSLESIEAWFKSDKHPQLKMIAFFANFSFSPNSVLSSRNQNMFTKIGLSWKSIEGSHRLMLLIILALGLFNFLFGETVPTGDGLGWDGVQYAEMVRNLDSLILEGQLNSYYAQRILPSAIVRGIIQLSATKPFSNANIIQAFEIYNLLLLLGACWTWREIANTAELSLSGRWIGFSGIFVNYECSKQAFYYPVLTDVTALLIALLLLRFYVQKKSIALFLTTIVGAFVWPVASISGAGLLFFLDARASARVSDIDPNGKKHSRFPLGIQAASLITVFLLSAGSYFALIQNATTMHRCAIPAYLASRMGSSIVTCTLEGLHTGLPTLAGMLIALFTLIGSRSYWLSIIASSLKTRPYLIVLTAAALAIPALTIKAISNPALANPTNLQFLIEFMLLPPPGLFFLAPLTLVVFWGPLMLLAFLYWKEFCCEVRRLGPGVVAIIGISIPLGLACEPRFITVGWPFFVLGIVMVLERTRFKRGFQFALIALTIAYAQFWMRFNLVPWESSPDPLEYPRQLYYMHYGLWMSWESYIIQFSAVIFSAIWLYKNIRNIEGFKYTKRHAQEPAYTGS